MLLNVDRRYCFNFVKGRLKAAEQDNVQAGNTNSLPRSALFIQTKILYIIGENPVKVNIHPSYVCRRYWLGRCSAHDLMIHVWLHGRCAAL
jgi:hypothetical protein